MAVPFSQLVATTYDGVVNDRNKPANQWAEAAALNALESMGGIKRVNGGATLEMSLDYRSNTAADFLASDTTTTSTSKTEVITAASYSYAELVVPVNWSMFDEALNSGPERKIELAASIVDNAIASHDQAIETALFAASATDGFESLRTILTEDGTGTIGSIDAGTETWWKNQFKDYTDASALLADMRTLSNACAKGSGGSEPSLILCGSTEYGVYEGKLVANQRFTSKTANGGFESLSFGAGAKVVFSQGATNDSYFFINPKNLQLHVVKGAFRRRGEVIEHINAAMLNLKIFSVLQLGTNNRSRVGVLFT